MFSNSEGWLAIKKIFEDSDNDIVIREGENVRSAAILQWAGISLYSDLEQVIENTEEVVVDNWIHLLGHGKGSDGQSIFILSSLHDGDLMKDGIVVATDILGGLFALCMDKNSEYYNEIFYLQPEYLEWEYSEMDYSSFLVWLASDDIDSFYKEVRWTKWKELASLVGIESAIRFTPDIWMEDCDIETAPKEIIPFRQLLESELSVYLTEH